MTYLLVKEKDKKNYALYCPDTFGAESWGSSSSQTGLKKKRKSWYIETWYSGGEWLEDEITETKLNVVKETADLDEIIRYLVNHNEKEIEHIYKDARKIYNEYLDLSEYFHKNY
jgi:hypothetical protein